MTAWYGESYQADGVGTVSGTAVDVRDWRLHFDAATHIILAGDDVIVGSFADPADFSAFVDYVDPIAARWVLEVTGGSGTINLSAGPDPTWSYSDPALATTDLGTFDVTGPTTLTSGPMPFATHDMLAAQDEAVILRIQCVSGSVDVAQVKLRVWPAGGTGGAWVSGVDWVRAEGFVDRWYSTLDVSTPQLPTYSEAYDALKAAIVTLDGTPDVEYSSSPGGDSVRSFFYVFDNFSSAPFTPSGSAGASIALVSALPGSPEPEPSLPYGFDPNEVRQEDRASIRAAGGGDATVEFLGWSPAATLNVTNSHVGSVDLGSAPTLDPHPTNPAFRVGPFHHPSAFALRDGAVPLSELGGQNLALAVMADGYFGGPPTSDIFTSTSGILSSPLPFDVRIANYEWFDPSAVAVQPRFYVKHRDDSMRPVGFGKPASELTVFRVPGGGRWRDLTTDEYATYGPTVRPPGGVALKVKRLDVSGSPWWDHVAWMVPDA